jgi:hypothetical protein
MNQERRVRGENLVFATAEEAGQFRESVEYAQVEHRGESQSRDREVVGEVLAEKFDQEGHGVSSLHAPWEHSQAEHDEVQVLVDMAFTHDLAAALRKAEQSPSFPRNIDLFHDVLTGELYEAVRTRRLNTAHVPVWIIIASTLLVVLFGAAIFMFFYSL